VVGGSVVVNLVDWNNGVGDVWLNGLLLDDWLDGLVNVVVNVLATDGWLDGLGVLALALNVLVLVLGLLQPQLLGNLLVVAVLEVAVLDGGKVVVVHLWLDLLVEDWLDRGVVVVLVNLFVDSGLNILVLDKVVSLLSDGWSDLLVDGGVVVAGLAEERLNCALCGIHCDD